MFPIACVEDVVDGYGFLTGKILGLANFKLLVVVSVDTLAMAIDVISLCSRCFETIGTTRTGLVIVIGFGQTTAATKKKIALTRVILILKNPTYVV